jgi:hypothetical protein
VADTATRVKLKIVRITEELADLAELAGDPDDHYEMLSAYRAFERFVKNISPAVSEARKAWEEAADASAAIRPTQRSFDDLIKEAETVAAEADSTALVLAQDTPEPE